ncbi:unnamed protein product [Linum trigynum]|uniref:F-box domain-containing protein n=1 Tax=Linum trigynum TaxID=586398 RepID=A0AAV2F0H3_9ROSI
MQKKKVSSGGGSRRRSDINLLMEHGMMTEVLIRLPEILRCKVVSKQWLSLIQSPCFSAAYTCHKMKEMAVADSCSLVLNTNGRETASILTSPNIHSGNHSSRLSNFSIDFLPYQSYEDSLQYFELKATDKYTADQNLFQLSRVERRKAWARYDGNYQGLPVPFQLPEPHSDPSPDTGLNYEDRTGQRRTRHHYITGDIERSSKLKPATMNAPPSSTSKSSRRHKPDL